MRFVHQLHAADKGTGGGTAAQAQAGPQKTVDATGAQGDTPEGENGGEGEVSFSPEQQKKIDALIKERLERAKEQAKQEVEAAQAKATKQAEEQRLADQQEWQQLAAQRQSTITDLEARVADLEPRVKDAKRYEQVLAGYRDKLIEGVPDHIRTLLDGRDVADQLEYLTQYRDQLVTTDNKNNERAPWGPPPAPAGRNGAGSATGDQQRAQQAYRPRF